MVGKEAGSRSIVVGREMEGEVGCPVIATESCGNGLFAMIDELVENFVVLDVCISRRQCSSPSVTVA